MEITPEKTKEAIDTITSLNAMIEHEMQNDEILCPSCGNDATESMRDGTFPYGLRGSNQYKQLQVEVPVISCNDCGDFCDDRAELIRSQAIEDHLYNLENAS